MFSWFFFIFIHIHSPPFRVFDPVQSCWKIATSYCTQSSLEMCDFVPNIPTVYNGTLPFWKCLKILNCILYCITAFKVEKNALKKNQKLSEVAVGGGGGLETSDTVWSFMLFFNLSLSLWRKQSQKGGPINNLLGIYPILKLDFLVFFFWPGTLFI